MVGKLLKYEIKYYLKTLIFILPITLIFGISTLITTPLRKMDSSIAAIYYLNIMLLVVSVMICLIVPAILNVIRFYKNMFCNEGYLTFSLPVSNHAHIISKLIAGTIFTILSGLVSIIAVFLSQAANSEFWVGLKNMYVNITMTFSYIPPVHLIFYIIETLLICLIGIFTGPLIYYSCISIGQLGKKNRVLLAVGVYYGYSVAFQVLGTVLTILLTYAGFAGIYEIIGSLMVNYPYASVHVMCIIVIIFELGLGALFYFITYKIMTKKLNLE